MNIPGVDALSRYTGTTELLFKIRKNLFETLTFVARKASERSRRLEPGSRRARAVGRLVVDAAGGHRRDPGVSRDAHRHGGRGARGAGGVAVRICWLVLALVAVDRAVMIWRWILLLRASGVPVATGAGRAVFLVSSFVGSFLPAGRRRRRGAGLEPGPDHARGGEALASVAVDRLLGVLSLAAMGVAGLLAWAPSGGGAGRVVPARGRARRGVRRGLLGRRG